MCTCTWSVGHLLNVNNQKSGLNFWSITDFWLQHIEKVHYASPLITEFSPFNVILVYEWNELCGKLVFQELPRNMQWPTLLTLLSMSVCLCTKKLRSEYCFDSKTFFAHFQPSSNKMIQLIYYRLFILLLRTGSQLYIH